MAPIPTTLSDLKVTFVVWNLSNTSISGTVDVLTSKCWHTDRKASIACNFNCCTKTEGLLKITAVTYTAKGQKLIRSRPNGPSNRAIFDDLSDLRDHSAIASHFKCCFSYSCAAVDKISFADLCFAVGTAIPVDWGGDLAASILARGRHSSSSSSSSSSSQVHSRIRSSAVIQSSEAHAVSAARAIRFAGHAVQAIALAGRGAPSLGHSLGSHSQPGHDVTVSVVTRTLRLDRHTCNISLITRWLDRQNRCTRAVVIWPWIIIGD